MVVCDQVVSKTQYQKLMESSGEQEEKSADEEENPSDEEENPSGEENELSSDEENELSSDEEGKSSEQSSDEQEEEPSTEHLKNLHDADEGRTAFIRKSFSLVVSRKHPVGHIRI